MDRSRSRRVSALLATGQIPTSILITCPQPHTAGQARSGTRLFTGFSQFIHLICCTKPTYKTDAHTRPSGSGVWKVSVTQRFGKQNNTQSAQPRYVLHWFWQAEQVHSGFAETPLVPAEIGRRAPPPPATGLAQTFSSRRKTLTCIPLQSCPDYNLPPGSRAPLDMLRAG